jgi:hypothetical protein
MEFQFGMVCEAEFQYIPMGNPQGDQAIMEAFLSLLNEGIRMIGNAANSKGMVAIEGELDRNGFKKQVKI